MTELKLRKLFKEIFDLSTEEANKASLDELKQRTKRFEEIVDEDSEFDVTYKGETVRFFAWTQKDLKEQIRKKFNVKRVTKDFKIEPAKFISD